MKYKLRMEVGDPSRNGHGQSETIYFNSNKSTQELKEAYEKSCDITGLTWTSDKRPKVNGMEMSWNTPEYENRQLFVEYESYKLSDLAKSILEKHGLDVDEEWDAHSALCLFFDFLRISLPDFKVEFAEDNTELLDLTICYGLFE